MTLNQFKTIVMSCSKQFNTINGLGLDLYKVSSSAMLQMWVFSIKTMNLLIKILNTRRPRIEPWGIPVKVSIHSLIADPIFTFCFRFEKYLKVIKFPGYLISRLEKNYIFRVFNFAICWLRNISRVLNFAISVIIRNKSLIEYQFFIVNECNCCQICYRNSNFVTISRHMRYVGINIILWANIRKKRISNSAGI